MGYHDCHGRFQCKFTESNACWQSESVAMERILGIILLVLVSSTSVHAILREKPRNVAVVASETVRFECKGDTSDGFLSWDKSNPIQPSSFTNIALNGDTFTDARYSVIFDYVNFKSTLTIIRVQNEDAATFSCAVGFAPNEQRSYSQLLVLESQPKCDTATPLNQLSRGNTLSAQCSVNYNTQTQGYAPVMNWFYLNGPSITATDQSQPRRLIKSFTTSVISSMIGQQLRVVTTFPPLNRDQLLDSNWDHDLRAPLYNYVYSSPVIGQQGAPVTQVTFYNKKTIYGIGETIICQSDGQPIPAKRWSNGARTIENPNLFITNSMIGQNRWTCTASNSIAGQLFTQQQSLEFYVDGSIIASASLVRWSFVTIFTCLGAAHFL